MSRSWPAERPDDALATPDGAGRHVLDVELDGKGQVSDVRLDGESIWPSWFKLEWKGDGQVSAKAGGLRLSSRAGDRISVRMPGSGGADPAAPCGERETR